MILGPRFTKRTTCREIPCGKEAIQRSGHEQLLLLTSGQLNSILFNILADMRQLLLWKCKDKLPESAALQAVLYPLQIGIRDVLHAYIFRNGIAEHYSILKNTCDMCIQIIQIQLTYVRAVDINASRTWCIKA